MLISRLFFVSQILHPINSCSCVSLFGSQVSTCGVARILNNLFDGFNGRSIWQLICICLLTCIIQVGQTINLVCRPVFCVRQIFCGCVSYDCVDGVRSCRIGYLLLIVSLLFVGQILHRINSRRCVSLFGSQVSTCGVARILNNLFDGFNRCGIWQLICIRLLACIIQVRQTINLVRRPVFCIRQVLCCGILNNCINRIRCCRISYLLLIIGFLFVCKILHPINGCCCIGLCIGQVSTCGVTGFFNDLFNCFNGRSIWQLICIRLLARIIQVCQTINLVCRPVLCICQVLCCGFRYNCINLICGCRVGYLLLIVSLLFVGQILHPINRCRGISLRSGQISACGIARIFNNLFNCFNRGGIWQLIEVSLLACII